MKTLLCASSQNCECSMQKLKFHLLQIVQKNFEGNKYWVHRSGVFWGWLACAPAACCTIDYSSWIGDIYPDHWRLAIAALLLVLHIKLSISHLNRVRQVYNKVAPQICINFARIFLRIHWFEWSFYPSLSELQEFAKHTDVDGLALPISQFTMRVLNGTGLKRSTTRNSELKVFEHVDLFDITL